MSPFSPRKVSNPTSYKEEIVTQDEAVKFDSKLRVELPIIFTSQSQSKTYIESLTQHHIHREIFDKKDE